MQKVFVTGATGFLGKKLIEQLVKKNIEIVCLVRDKSKLSIHKNIELVKGDLRESKSYEDALKGVDTVIHAAALVGVEDKEKNFDVNLKGTQELIKAMKKHDVKHCVFISSISAGLAQRSHYAESKRKAERELLLSGIPTTVLRLNVLIGKDSPQLTKIISMASLPIIPMVGSGKKVIQPIAVEDAVSVIIQAMTHLTTNQRTYTVSGKEKISYRDFLDMITEENLGKKKMKFGIPLIGCYIIAIGLKLINKPIITKGQIILINQDAVSSVRDLKKTFVFDPKPLKQIIREAK